MLPCWMCQVVFYGWVRFFDFGLDFFESGWVLDKKNHDPCPVCELVCVKNYGSYPPVVLIGLSRVESGFLGRVKLGWSGRAAHDQVYLS